jgi:hypothetical protein
MAPSARRRSSRSVRGDAQDVAVPVALDRDLVTGRDDVGRDRRMHAHLLAGDEERGEHAHRLQQVENLRRAARIRPIVEGQSHPVGVGDVVAHAEAWTQAGRHRAQRGQRMRENAQRQVGHRWRRRR